MEPAKGLLISGMEYYCLYHIIITSIDPIYSFYLVAFGLLWLLKFEFVRARFILNYFYFISMLSTIS